MASHRNEYFPDTVSPPGETLREALAELRITQAELATRMGRPQKTISEIINGKTAITSETALQLEMVLGIPADFWVNRESQYQEFLARKAQAEALEKAGAWAKRFPISEMVKLGMLPKLKTVPGRLNALLRFLGVSSPSQWEDLYGQYQVAFRKSSAFTADPNALGAWLRAGIVQSSRMSAEPYDRQEFMGALSAARLLTTETAETFVPRLQEICAAAGVLVVFVPQLPRSRVSGATRWVGPDRALIQLSLRYKSNDHLWFTFFHEAAHILLHQKKAIFLDSGSFEGEAEDEANRWAADFLIPPQEYDDFSRHTVFSKEMIVDFASSIRIAPGIVVGRLQHEGHLPRSHCNDLKVWLEWVMREAS